MFAQSYPSAPRIVRNKQKDIQSHLDMASFFFFPFTSLLLHSFFCILFLFLLSPLISWLFSSLYILHNRLLNYQSNSDITTRSLFPVGHVCNSQTECNCGYMQSGKQAGHEYKPGKLLLLMKKKKL